MAARLIKLKGLSGGVISKGVLSDYRIFASGATTEAQADVAVGVCTPSITLSTPTVTLNLATPTVSITMEI